MEKVQRKKPLTMLNFFSKATSETAAAETVAATLPIHVDVDEPKATPATAISSGDAHLFISEGQVNAVTFLCQKLKVQSSDLLTDDIRSHPEFMRALCSISASAKTYFTLLAEWKQNQRFIKKGSLVSTKCNQADSKLDELSKALDELSHMKVICPNLAVQLKSVQAKLSFMLGMLPLLFDTKTMMEEGIDRLQGSVRAQKARHFNLLTGTNEYKLIAGNSLGLSWQKALENLEELDNFVPLSALQLNAFPGIKDMCHHSGMVFIPGYVIAENFNLQEDNMKAAIDQLVSVYPLLCVQNGKHFVLIDYVELVFNPNLFHELLTLDSTPRSTSSEHVASASNRHAAEGVFFYQKPGPVPLQKKYPQILEVMMNFVRLHGFGAHIRRRTGTSTSCGIGLKDIRKHIIENVDGLNEISLTKVYYLLKPANSNSIDAARHKDALDIRVGTKSCDVSKENPHAHEYFATVANVRQLAAMYPDECVTFSCDSKAKIHIGGQAVSRYHQLRAFFPSDDQPHYADHDFPVPGYLIEPDGYLQLTSKDKPAFVKDKCGRDVVNVPSTGPLWVFNRCVKNTSTNIEDHVTDLKDIMKDNPSVKKPVLILVTDGGADWTPKSNINQFFLGKLWRDEQFDMVISACMPAGLSCYNPIEHLWSPCSKFLAGVSLPACLPGENTAPAQQSLPAEEKDEKEQKVFNNALDRLNDYWDGRVHDGFRITSKGVTRDMQAEVPSKYEITKEMLKYSMKGIRDDEQLASILEEWKFISKHMDRRYGFICFRKGSCGDYECECMTDEVKAVNVWKLPTGDRWLFPPITPDPECPGHYMTLQQLSTSLVFSNPDQHRKDTTATSCNKCRYVFTSVADEDKHIKLIHGGLRAFNRTDQAADKQHICQVCKLTYPTRYQLLKHQNKDNHKLKKGRPSVPAINDK